MSPPTEKFIFLSYARVDKSTATLVAETLDAAGLPVWWDAKLEHQYGSRWQSELQSNLDLCSLFIVLIGSDGVTGWVEPEVGMALDRHYSRANKQSQNGNNANIPNNNSGIPNANQKHHRLPIVPVLVGDTPASAVPSFLSHFQWFQLSLPPNSNADRLAVKLRESAFDGYRQIEMPPGGPYPGLAPYNSSLQHFFFGRQKAIYEVMRRWNKPDDGKRRRWLSIEGNSGMGKSSFMRAGVLPAVRAQWLIADNRDVGYHVLDVMHPGKDPINALSRVLSRHCGDSPAQLRSQMQEEGFLLSDLQLFKDQAPNSNQIIPVLPIDQLEEVFTQSDPEQASLLSRLLAEALEDDESPFYLVTTIRDDFLPRFSEDNVSPLANLLNNASRFALGRVDKQGLHDIVNRPIELAGLGWSDTHLPDEIVNEANGEPGALVLVNNLMQDLYTNSDNATKQITRDRFQELGGVAGAFKESADNRMQSIGTEAEQEAAWSILLALVQSPDGITHTKRSIERVRARESSGLSNSEADVILDRLSGLRTFKEESPARLIVIEHALQPDDRTTADEKISPGDSPTSHNEHDQVNLIHESLVRLQKDKKTPFWPEFHSRIQRENYLTKRHRLEQDAQKWQNLLDNDDKTADSMLISYRTEFNAVKHFMQGADPTTIRYLNASELNLKSQLREHITGVTIFAAALLLLIASAVFYGDSCVDECNPSIFGFPDYFRINDQFRDNPDQFYPKLVYIECGKSDCNSQKSNTNGGANIGNGNQFSSFNMTESEITNKQYKAYLVGRQSSPDKQSKFRSTSNVEDELLSIEQEWPENTSEEADNLPVQNVNRDKAMNYSIWLGEQLGLSCSLPSDAEWTHAATGGEDVNFPWGNSAADAGTYAWFEENSGIEVKPVKTKKPTSFGLYDIAGNVWEWTTDCFEEKSNTNTCRAGTVRGGSVGFGSNELSASYRFRALTSSRNNSIGFRVLCRSN